jgi:hypothetical protein
MLKKEAFFGTRVGFFFASSLSRFAKEAKAMERRGEEDGADPRG